MCLLHIPAIPTIGKGSAGVHSCLAAFIYTSQTRVSSVFTHGEFTSVWNEQKSVQKPQR